MIKHYYDEDGNLVLERDGVKLVIPSEQVGDVLLWAIRRQPDRVEAEIGGVDPIR